MFLVWGREDSTTPLWQGRALQRLFPHAELSILEKAGHMAYVERPVELNQLLLAFFEAPL